MSKINVLDNHDEQGWIQLLDQCNSKPELAKSTNNDFDCQCGQEYFDSIEAYQLELNSGTYLAQNHIQMVARVLLHQHRLDRRLCSKIVKLPDMLANLKKGRKDDSSDDTITLIVSQILKAILLCHTSSNTSSLSPFVLSVISSACQNYRIHFADILRQDYISQLPTYQVTLPCSVINQALFVALLEQDNLDNIDATISLDDNEDIVTLKSMSKRLILRFNALNWHLVSLLVCFLAQKLHGNLAWILDESMTLWADPVIAKAYVHQEVIHYTQISLLIFSHMNPKVVLDHQDQLIKWITKGLPNHFTSTDHRSIQLAKYFCEIVTETLKAYDKKEASGLEESGLPMTLVRPEEEVNRKMVQSVHHQCRNALAFWCMFGKEEEAEVITKVDKTDKDTNVQDDGIDDDDDDDDLDPIETLDAPTKCQIAYIRDFIDVLKEDKPYDEKLSLFQSLPNVVLHQLKLEHPQVGRDLLDLLVQWTNDFDCPLIEKCRKSSLCNALLSRMDGNVQHLCASLVQKSTSVPVQALLLDVLSNVANQTSLSDLQTLSKAAFDILHLDLFRSPQVPIRIPLILFYHRLLSIMPLGMIRAEMLNAYLKALTSLGDDTGNIDKATEQTIAYSLHHLMPKLRDVQLASPESDKERISQGLNSMRSWLWQLQQNPVEIK